MKSIKIKEKKKNKAKENNLNTIYHFNENYEKLNYEIQNFKSKNFKKDSNKVLKIKYFTKYLESLNYSLENSKITFLWNKHFFLNQFLSELEIYPKYEEPITKIIEVLCGNFSNSKKIQKMLKYLKDYENESNIYLKQKLCSFYSIQLFNSNKIILFCICLQNDNNSNPKTGSANIYFVSITEEWNFEKDALDFINKYIFSDDEKFPYIEFDKSGYFMSKELLFSDIKKDNCIEVCFPLKNILTEKRTIFKMDIINGKMFPLFNEAKDFITSEINNSIISQVENDEYEDIIKESINGRFWKDIQLSNQEKDKIFPSKPFIISGRPGTGKTTVILVKLFAIYYNFYLKKEKRKEDYLIKKINLNNEKKYTSKLRVVFTSYSQELCKEQMKSFIQMVKKVKTLKFKEMSEIKMKEISSFRDVDSYPIFVNFRKIMFMIDGSLTFQFFKRKDLKIYENPDDSLIYFDEEKKYECNNYFILSEENYKNNFINFFYHSPELDKDNPVIHLKESNENTFDKFYNNYLNNGTDLSKKLKELNLKSIEIYAQYISIIKGSFTSHLYPTNCITLEDYKKKGKKITDSLFHEVVYEICIEFENYKRKSGYFDIQDLTNFLIRQVLIEFNDIKLIDYIFIDEIQDLTVSQILLLILVSKYCKIYAGDACQTISKVNRFRLSELNNIFYNFQKVLPDFDSVVSANLTLNYRLNSKIMNLSTYMAFFIRECFPNTLDKFQDDFSIKVTDHKPMLLSNIGLLFSIFKDEKNNLLKNLTLSSLHCFICRDKIIKNKLIKKNVMPRTIEESKGLEYEIVIVYNFFSTSSFYYLWDKLFREENLNELIKDSDSSILKIENILIKEDLIKLVKSLKLKQFYFDMGESEIKDKIINEFKIMKYPNLKNDFDIHRNFGFCSELKQFYVIITRPRTFLLFYEEKDIKNFSFFNRMINNGIIKKVNNDFIYIDEIINYYEKNKMLCKTKEEMKIFADIAFDEEKYEDAVYLYGKAGKENYQKKAIIYMNYKIIKEEKRNHQQLSLDELKKLNHDTLKYINEIKILKPKIFEDNENIEAFCYLNLEEYDKAIELYKKNKMYNQIGDIYYNKLNNYEKAFDYYKKGGNVSNAIKSLVKSDQYGYIIKLFEYLNDNNNCIQLGLSDYYNNYKKYINNYFNYFYTPNRYIKDIYNEKDEEGQEENENVKKIEENKENEENNNNEIIKSKKFNVNNVNINIITGNESKNKKENEQNENIKNKKKSGKRKRIFRKKNNYSNLINQEEENDDNEEEIEDNNEDENENENNEIEIKSFIDDNKEEKNNNENDMKEDNNKNNKNYIKENNNNKKEELKYYKKESEKEYLGEEEEEEEEEEEKKNDINNKIEKKQDDKNFITKDSSEPQIKEFKEQKINLKFSNIEDEYNSFNNYNFRDYEKLNEIINIDILKNDSKDKSIKKLITEIIRNYYKNIKILEKKRELNQNYYCNNYDNDEINLSRDLVNKYQNELKLSEKNINLIECYFFNVKEHILKEIIRIMPEIYYYKSKQFKNNSDNIKDLMKLMKKTNDKIYNSIINITKIFIYKADLINEKIYKIIYPLFYINNFYDITIVIRNNFNKDNFGNINNNDDLLINLTLNNINKPYEMQKQRILTNFNYLIYYLNYKLRYCLTIFIKSGKNIFENEEIFITYKSQFNRLIQLVNDIKNQNYQNIHKINIRDLNKLIDYYKAKDKNNIIINKNNISEFIDLLDITSYISLLLFQIYIDNYSTDNNYNNLIENNSSDIYSILFILYKFSLIFNENNNTISYHKKILIFSLFNIFSICPFPNIPEFSIYNNINCCIMNKFSILFSDSFEGAHFDVFKDKNNIVLFDTNGNNLLMKNNILYQLFMIILSNYVNLLFKKNENKIVIPQDPFKPNYKFIQKETFYHEIMYYSDFLNYKISQNKENKNNNEYISLNGFWEIMIEKCINDFNGFKTYYPFKSKNNYSFSLYNYLIGFFFNSISSPQVLLSFIKEYNDRISFYKYRKGDIYYNEIYILFNFIKIYFTKVNLDKYKNDLAFKELKISSNNINLDFSELLNIFRCIQENRPSLIVSMLFLRRLLPNILYYISEGTGIKTMIYFYENETLFDNGTKLLNIKLEKKQDEKIIDEYIKSLKQVLCDFSLNGKKFSPYFKDIKFRKGENFIENRNHLFYDFGINKINNKNAEYEESIEILKCGYTKNIYNVQIDYNWNFQFFEFLFHCFYLTFAECSNSLKNINNINKGNSSKLSFEISINDFLDYYELNDYYLNFINKEGANMNISRLIKINYDDNFNYKLFNDKYILRKESLHFFFFLKRNVLKKEIDMFL